MPNLAQQLSDAQVSNASYIRVHINIFTGIDGMLILHWAKKKLQKDVKKLAHHCLRGAKIASS